MAQIAIKLSLTPYQRKPQTFALRYCIAILHSNDRWRMIHQNESVEGNVTNSWWKKWQPKFMYTFSISFISVLVQFLRLLQWKVDISLQETCISNSRTWVKWYAGWDSACNWKCVYRIRISHNAYCSQKNNIKYSSGSEQEF